MLRKIRSLVSNSDYFGIYNNVLSANECEVLINQFEKSNPVNGYTSKGYTPEVKKCKQIEGDFEDNSVTSNILRPHLISCIGKYSEEYPGLCELDSWKYDNLYCIKKFESSDDGFKVWHCEHGPLYSENGKLRQLSANRILVWMFYLNDAKSGTDFIHYPTVRAKMGRCIIWPAGWSHIHKSAPNKGLKYIISGWISYQ